MTPNLPPSEAEARELLQQLRDGFETDRRHAIQGNWPGMTAMLDSKIAVVDKLLATLPQDRPGDARELERQARELLRDIFLACGSHGSARQVEIDPAAQEAPLALIRAALSQDRSEDEGAKQADFRIEAVRRYPGRLRPERPAFLAGCVYGAKRTIVGSQDRSEGVGDADLRTTVYRAIWDPGALVGPKGETRDLTDWQTDAVMVALGSQHRSPPDGMVLVPREVLVASKAGLGVLGDMCGHVDLTLGKAKAAEIEGWINDALSAAPSAPPKETGA